MSNLNANFLCVADVLKHIRIIHEAKSVDLHRLLFQDQVSGIREQWL